MELPGGSAWDSRCARLISLPDDLIDQRFYGQTLHDDREQDDNLVSSLEKRQGQRHRNSTPSLNNDSPAIF